MRDPPACCISSCVLACFLFFADLPFIFRLRFGRRLFQLVFSCAYYAVSSVSVSAAIRIAYDIIYLYLDKYVR